MVHGSCGLFANAVPGSAMSRGFGEHAHLAVVGDVVLLVGRDHLEAQAAGVVGAVPVDVRAA